MSDIMVICWKCGGKHRYRPKNFPFRVTLPEKNKETGKVEQKHIGYICKICVRKSAKRSAQKRRDSVWWKRLSDRVKEVIAK